MREGIDETAWPATDCTAESEYGALFELAGQYRSQRARSRHGDRFSTAEWCRRNDRKGTLIRHASLGLAPPVATLPVAVIEPAFRAALVPAVGRAVLAEPGLDAASRAAVLLPTITAGTNPEQRLASLAATNPWPENHLTRNCHARCRRVWTTGSQSWQGRTSLMTGSLLRVAKPGPSRSNGRGPNAIPASRTNGNTIQQTGLMIDG